jgi:hypothetical protein
MAEGFRLASSRVTDPRCWYRSRRRGGSVISPPVPTKVGQRADMRVEHCGTRRRRYCEEVESRSTPATCASGSGTECSQTGTRNAPRLKSTASTTASIYRRGEFRGSLRARHVVGGRRAGLGRPDASPDGAVLGNGSRPRGQAVVRGMVFGDSTRGCPKRSRRLLERAVILTLSQTTRAHSPLGKPTSERSRY